jgi:hypothetical protein
MVKRYIVVLRPIASSLFSETERLFFFFFFFFLLYTKASSFNLIQRTCRHEQCEDAKLRDNSGRTGKTT